MLADFDGVKKWCMKMKAEQVKRSCIQVIEDRTDIDRETKDRFIAVIEREHSKVLAEYGIK
jgi:hypothetical protein